MLNVPYNFLNGFELISKMTRGASQSAEIRRSAEKSHAWINNFIGNIMLSWGLCAFCKYDTKGKDEFNDQVVGRLSG